MSILLKEHKTKEKIVVAICDENIYGKKFVENLKSLDLTSEFFNGNIADEKEILEKIANSNLISAVGNESVSFLKKIGCADKIIKVKGIPHAECAFEN
jgi:uncharacterized protein